MKITETNFTAIEEGTSHYLTNKGYPVMLIECDDHQFGIELDMCNRGDCYTIEEYEDMRAKLDYAVSLAKKINAMGLEVIEENIHGIDQMMENRKVIRTRAAIISRLLEDGRSLEYVVRTLVEKEIIPWE